MYGVVLHAHPVRGESHNQRNTTGEVATTSPPFYNELHRSHVLCVKAELRTTFTSWSQHHFVAIGNRSGNPEPRIMYGVVLHAHPVRGESHNQRNTTGEVATVLQHQHGGVVGFTLRKNLTHPSCCKYN